MHKSARYIAAGVAAGILLSVGFALAGTDRGQSVVLSALPQPVAQGFDTSRLVKFDGRQFEIAYDASVSTDVLTSTTVKKIEAGRVSYVSIGTTATGTYSSDALTSKHVKYPGISVQEVSADGTPISVLSKRRWGNLESVSARSVLIVQ